MITYNQGKYIAECLQSIIDQKTNFDFEIIIGDDSSSDATPEVIRNFAERHPNKIIPIFHTSKIGGTQNYVLTHLRATGEYVAHIDGDDIAYPGKLQRQAELLDQREGLALVWHIMNIFNDSGKIAAQTHPHLSDVVDTKNITLRDILRFGPLGAASSVMYRRSLADYLSEIRNDTLDFYFAARIMERGGAERINDILGGYRVNPVIETLSKRSSPYFRRSPMRRLYASHLVTLFNRNRKFKADIFLNSIFNMCVEIRFMRPTIAEFLGVALRTFSITGLKGIPKYFFQAFRLRAK